MTWGEEEDMVKMDLFQMGGEVHAAVEDSYDLDVSCRLPFVEYKMSAEFMAQQPV